MDESIVKGVPGAEPAMHRCLIAALLLLLVWQTLAYYWHCPHSDAE